MAFKGGDNMITIGNVLFCIIGVFIGASIMYGFEVFMDWKEDRGGQRMKTRFKRWNEWRKSNMNSKIHQLLVLLGIRKSPTFELFITQEEWEDSYMRGFYEGLKGGDKS